MSGIDRLRQQIAVMKQAGQDTTLLEQQLARHERKADSANAELDARQRQAWEKQFGKG